MNLSSVVSTLKMQRGLYGITLPFKDDITGKPIPTEQVIRDVLVNITIPEYSQFVPWKRKGDIKISDMECVNEKESIYRLPAFLTLTDIMYISNIQMSYFNNRGTYGDVNPAYGINRSVEGVVTSQAYMMVASQMRSEPSWEYLGSNLVRLYGYPHGSKISISVACAHEPNGETIPESCRDSFMELGILDIKAFIYNTLKLYEEIPTAFGNIKLNIQEYQSAESDRDQLLDKWRDVFHLDQDWEQYL